VNNLQDGQTVEDYEKNLDENLAALLNRFKTGSYRPPPVRRVHIPKEDGRRPSAPYPDHPAAGGGRAAGRQAARYPPPRALI